MADKLTLPSQASSYPSYPYPEGLLKVRLPIPSLLQVIMSRQPEYQDPNHQYQSNQTPYPYPNPSQQPGQFTGTQPLPNTYNDHPSQQGIPSPFFECLIG